MTDKPQIYYREVDAMGVNEQPVISRIKYRVVKRTPKGAWIVPTWASSYTPEDEAVNLKAFGKFVLDGIGRRYAYPTPELARESYIIRKRRQIQHAKNTLEKATLLLAYAKAGAPPMPEFLAFELDELEGFGDD